jgi:hypothetical protein
VNVDRMLDGVTQAADEMRHYRQKEAEARADLRLIVRAAVDAGIPVTAITKAAGWSQRASVYNLLKADR